MALMKCPECGGDLSDQAESCPHCGYPVKRGKPRPVTEQSPASAGEAQQTTPSAPEKPEASAEPTAPVTETPAPADSSPAGEKTPPAKGRSRWLLMGAVALTLISAVAGFATGADWCYVGFFVGLIGFCLSAISTWDKK